MLSATPGHHIGTAETVGLVNMRSPIRAPSPLMRMLFQIMDERGIRAHDIAIMLEITPNTVWNWRAGNNEPSLVWVEKIAAVLGYEIKLEKKT